LSVYDKVDPESCPNFINLIGNDVMRKRAKISKAHTFFT